MHNKETDLIERKLRKSIHRDSRGDLISRAKTQELAQEYQKSLEALTKYKKDCIKRFKEISERELRDAYY